MLAPEKRGLLQWLAGQSNLFDNARIPLHPNRLIGGEPTGCAR
jgi:hypothetical protein